MPLRKGALEVIGYGLVKRYCPTDHDCNQEAVMIFIDS